MSRPELHSGKVKNESVLAELTTRSHRKTDDCQRPPPFKPNVGERSMLDEQLYGSFLLPASLFSKVTLNQFGGGPKAQAVNLTGGFSGNRNHSATLANNYEGHVCELTTVFTVRSLSAKMKEYNRVTARNYTFGLIFVLAGGRFHQHLQHVLSHHGPFQA